MIRLHEYTGLLSDLTKCLRNPTLQLSRSLVRIEVNPLFPGEYKKQEVEGLMAHNGEFLPVTKEKHHQVKNCRAQSRNKFVLCHEVDLPPRYLHLEYHLRVRLNASPTVGSIQWW
ncbi:unnamed protein product [Phytophthora fragariaefolia]|uniref:Unnamed protein product n=1 Tax=Phytophthora fragariaefolia TaxID=1490495 RepID=A0A9W6XJ14_9STRA|nr:unnamed protein product [Phytophthora fragariaefolia]